MACDDTCTFKMSVDDPHNPDALQLLMRRDHHTRYRNSDIGDKTESEDNPAYGKSFSEWVTLVKDEYYYVEAELGQGGGIVHINVGMEVRATPADAGHPKLEAQVQEVSVMQTNLEWDTLEILVVGADQGEFVLAYQVPGTSDFWQSGTVVAGGDAEQMRRAIGGFYNRYGTQPIVTVGYLDANGLPTTEDAAYTTVYKIETPAILRGPSVENIMVVPQTTGAQIHIVYPTEK